MLFAGLTVCIALLGQLTLGVGFLDGLAVSSALAVALTMATSLTLLPAMLGFLGPKVLSRRSGRRSGQISPSSKRQRSRHDGHTLSKPTQGRCCSSRSDSDRWPRVADQRATSSHISSQHGSAVVDDAPGLRRTG